MTQILEFQPGVTSADVARLFRQLADRADRGEIIGVAIATLGPHNRYGDAFAVAPQHQLAMLGASSAMHHSLLRDACEGIDVAMKELER